MVASADNSRFELALQFVLKWEGGYVNHPADPGGETNFGVTASVYDSYRRALGLMPRSVRHITESEVRQIYRERYWKPSQCDRFNDALAVVGLDTAVNFGVSGFIMFLQEALPAPPVDGIWGPITEAAFIKCSQDHIARRIVDLRQQYRYSRVRQKPSQSVFLVGWLNRDNDLGRLVNRLTSSKGA